MQRKLLLVTLGLTLLAALAGAAGRSASLTGEVHVAFVLRGLAVAALVA